MILYGAGGHAKVVVDLLAAQEIVVDGIVDDNPDVAGVFDVPVVSAAKLTSGEACIITVGNNAVRKTIAEKITADFIPAIHRSAVISPYASLGKGSVVCANAVINAGAAVGAHVIINTAAVVEHDCLIEDFVHISPNASLAGAVTVGEGTHIGTGAIVIPGIKIGKWCTVGAGAVVIKDVPDHTTVVGNPAKPINRIKESSK